MNGTQKNMKQIVAAVERKAGEGKTRTWWTRVGVAFENGDGSYNLLFDFIPTDMQRTTLQLRDIDQERRGRSRRREEAGDEAAQ